MNLLQSIKNAKLKQECLEMKPKHFLCGRDVYRYLLVLLYEDIWFRHGRPTRVMGLDIVVSSQIDPNHWEVIPEINPRTGT